MRPRLLSLRAAIAAEWRTQIRLQQRYADRFENSGMQLLEEQRWLRWSGGRLVGDLLPRYNRWV